MSRQAAASSLAVALLFLVPGPVLAQQGILQALSANVDFTVSVASSTLTTPTGTTRTRTNNLFPRLTLTVDTLVYPGLRLNTGGVFEVNSSTFTTGGVESDTRLTNLRPFFQLRAVNPVFAPGIGYFRRETRTRNRGTAGLNVVNEDYVAYLLWKPIGGPQSTAQFIRTNTFDPSRNLEDGTKNFASLLSRYTYRDFRVNYNGSYIGTVNRLRLFESRQWSNAVRLDLAKAFLQKRLQWNTTYTVNRQNITSVAGGEDGEVALPVPPFAGLASLSDTPVTAALAPNPLLVDGNLTAGAGVNFGLPGLGQESQARNLGLDFLTPTAINRLLVWVDRELPGEIASSFSWEVYSSADNITWRRETVGSAAPFGPFENRFQIDFPAVTARYLKVVTRPLSIAVTDASRFPQIFVTELQAFVKQAADGARDRVSRTAQILNSDVRFRLLETPALYYEGSYWLATAAPRGTTRDTLSNGLSVSHRFGRIFTVNGRGAVEQGRQPDGYRLAAVRNATLTVAPIHTFTGSVIYSGLNERIDRRTNSRTGLFVQTMTQLYRGIDLQLGGGLTLSTDEAGQSLRGRLLNVGAVVAPRSNLSITLDYADTTSTRPGPSPSSSSSSSILAGQSRRGFLTVAYDPIRTLHLVVGEEVIVQSGQNTRTTHNLGANWAPLPDGALQLIFAYNEALRDLEFGKERFLKAGVRWNVSRGSYIDLSYQRIRSELVFQKTDTKILSVDVKLFL